MTLVERAQLLVGVNEILLVCTDARFEAVLRIVHGIGAAELTERASVPNVPEPSGPPA